MKAELCWKDMNAFFCYLTTAWRRKSVTLQWNSSVTDYLKNLQCTKKVVYTFNFIKFSQKSQVEKCDVMGCLLCTNI